jgi:hypothetical protein
MRKTLENVLLPKAELELRRFSAGEVAEFLLLPSWRLQKFLNSPQYGLSSAGQLVGKGRGSRRTFSRNDLYLIGLAALLVRDGFAAKFVGQVLEELRDVRLVDWDKNGDEFTLGIAFGRGVRGPRIELFRSENPPQVGIGAPFYYAVDLNDVIQVVEKQITRREKQEKRREGAN